MDDNQRDYRRRRKSAVNRLYICIIITLYLGDIYEYAYGLRIIQSTCVGLCLYIRKENEPNNRRQAMWVTNCCTTRRGRAFTFLCRLHGCGGCCCNIRSSLYALQQVVSHTACVGLCICWWSSEGQRERETETDTVLSSLFTFFFFFFFIHLFYVHFENDRNGATVRGTRRDDEPNAELKTVPMSPLAWATLPYLYVQSYVRDLTAVTCLSDRDECLWESIV